MSDNNEVAEGWDGLKGTLEDALIENLLKEEKAQEEYEARLNAQMKAARLIAEQREAANPVRSFSSKVEESQWLAGQIADDAAKLSALYQEAEQARVGDVAVFTDTSTIQIRDKALSELSNQLASNSRQLRDFLGRMEYDQALETQRANTIVGKTSFKTPANWGPTRLTNENVDATIAEVRAIRATPLTRDFWPQPVKHDVAETAIVPAPSPPSIWKRFLYFLGFSVPEITDNHPRAAL